MARRATIIIEASTGSAKKNLASLEDGLNDVDVAAVEAGEGFERMGDDAASSAATVQRATNQATTALQQQSTAASTVAQSQTSLRKTTSSTASQLTTDLVQASQDAAFGFENLAASAPFVAEQFGRLQRQAGGTASALGAIGTSLTNPVTGIIAAFTLLLTFKDEIIGFFTDTADAAGDTAEEVQSAAAQFGQINEETLGDIREDAEAQEEVLSALEDTQERLTQQQAQLFRDDNADPKRIQEVSQQLRAVENVMGVLEGSTGEVQERMAALVELGLPASVAESIAEASTEQEGAADETERQEKAMNGLAVSAKQAAENMVTVRRTLNSMDQMPMQRRISAFGAGFQAPTVGGTMLNQGQSQGGLMLEAAQDAGFVEGFMDFSDVFRGGGGGGQTGQPEGLEAVSMSLEEIQQEFGVSEDKARQFKRTANQQLGSVINAAGQLGQSLVRAFSKGERSAKSIAASLLQGVGGVLSVIPGVGQIAGPVLGQLGGLIGAFDEGGVVNTPLQVVGESGPELAALPQGTRVSTARETERMLSGAQNVNVSIETELRRLPNGDLGVAVREAAQRNQQYQS